VDEETALSDSHNYYHKYHCVEVDFGDVSSVSRRGTDKITKDIFGEEKMENA